MTPRWTIRLAASAEQDYHEILRWTVKHFGRGQAKTLSNALRDLALGRSIIGARLREDIGSGINALHVARKGRKGRHFFVFRVDSTHGKHIIDVLRLLHDSVDLPRQRPAANEGESS